MMHGVQELREADAALEEGSMSWRAALTEPIEPAQRVRLGYALKLSGRRTLVREIRTVLALKLVNNIGANLLTPQSEFAQQIIKDPYNFDFLSLGREMVERDLERGLLEHIRALILELGKGFAVLAGVASVARRPAYWAERLLGAAGDGDRMGLAASERSSVAAEPMCSG
ncbi:MAG TPA: PDDEXK nuclease domain-containing protein [Rhodanobacter sp.]|nr:PDDEXK nuclease domain-containing protein [Rhodanobacter sp.]